MKFAKPETSSERGAGISRLVSTVYRGREGFGFLRLCMVLVGFAPLFTLMAIRGIEVFRTGGCGLLALRWWSCP